MKEYPRDARNGLSIDAIKHYRNLQYHRSAILGGVRLIAFRNFDHLTRAATRLGISSLADDSDFDAVCDQMFKDQDMDPSLNNRTIEQRQLTLPVATTSFAGQ